MTYVGCTQQSHALFAVVKLLVIHDISRSFLTTDCGSVNDFICYYLLNS